MTTSRLQKLMDSGLYRDAAEVLKALSAPTIADQIIGHWLELHLGEPTTALSGSALLLEKDLHAADKVHALNVHGRSLLYAGRIHDACATLKHAVRVAESTGNLVLRSRAQAQLTKALLQWVSIEAALPEFSNLRRLAYAAGDFEALMEFHCSIAEFEMKRRGTAVAAKHLRVARSLCEGFQHPFFMARILTLEANNAILTGSREEAFEKARCSLEHADRSGSKIALGPALSTFAHAALLHGQFTYAETTFDRMLEIAAGRPASTLMAKDGLMQIALLTGNSKKAENLAADIWTEIETYPGPTYYVLWHAVTRVKWLLSQQRNSEALETVRRFLPDAIRAADTNLADALRLLEAEAVAACGDARMAAQLLSDAARVIEEMTPDNVLAIDKAIDLITGQGRRDSDDNDDVNQNVFDADSGLDLRNRHDQDGGEICRHVLKLASAVIDLGMDPVALGRQIASLVLLSGSATMATLTKSDRHGRRTVLASFPCSEQFDAKRTKHSHAVRLRCGRDADSEIELLVTPSSDATACLALLSLERLARVAIFVREARMRRREETALWIPDNTVQQLGMVCATERMADLVNITRRVAKSNVTVLFTGETGTGKELLARALHESSPRHEKPFIPFNCSAVARDMLDSQLFGYRRGAFTGAQEAFQGVIRAAAGGTLFLDEIGEISLDVQPKLLRFLESGEIHPLGEPKPIHVDVRIVAATNANLEQLVEQGRFREDLFYRLNVVRLQVPPLRERREEIPLLVQHYLEKFSRESHKTGLQFAEETMEYLVLFQWPGNVRQLANEIRRLVALAESGAVLMPEHLSHDIAASRRTIPSSERQLAPTEFVVRVDQPMSAALEHVERAMIQHALECTSGRVDDAARALGLSRKGLYLKRQRLQMTDEELPSLEPATPANLSAESAVVLRPTK